MKKINIAKMIIVIGALSASALAFVACGSVAGGKNLKGVYTCNSMTLTINDNRSYKFEYSKKVAVPMGSTYKDIVGYGKIEVKDGLIYFTDDDSKEASYGNILDNGDIDITYDPHNTYTVGKGVYVKSSWNE